MLTAPDTYQYAAQIPPFPGKVKKQKKTVILIPFNKTFSNGCKNTNLCLPHKPELEDVHVASALNGLVARVVRDIILFVLLEQVTSTHGVAALQ